MSGIAHEQRFSRNQPCPICGGWATMQRGAGSRCWGFLSADGRFAHCVRGEHAGSLQAHHDGTFIHRLAGSCRCGQAHGAAMVVMPNVSTKKQVTEYDGTLAAERIWQHARKADGSLVATYLANRGLTMTVPPSLRFQRMLRHSPSGTYWPAMLAAVSVWPSRQPTAIQRTWLRTDASGKAPVEPARMSLGPVQGGAVRLAPPGPVLVVAEGVESALSVQQATGLPAWAVVGVKNMRNLVLPDVVQEIVIAADNDSDGITWARLAAERWRTDCRRVRIALPPAGVADFNALLQRVVTDVTQP